MPVSTEVSGGTHTGLSKGPARRDGCEGMAVSGRPCPGPRKGSLKETPHSPERSPAVPEPRSREGGGGGGAGAAGGDGGRAGRVPAPRRSLRTRPPSAAAAAIGSRAAPRRAQAAAGPALPPSP